MLTPGPRMTLMARRVWNSGVIKSSGQSRDRSLFEMTDRKAAVSGLESGLFRSRF